MDNQRNISSYTANAVSATSAVQCLCEFLCFASKHTPVSSGFRVIVMPHGTHRGKYTSIIAIKCCTMSGYRYHRVYMVCKESILARDGVAR